uniref:Uncharacterized protein n=1 Tax=Strongyloides stercoralis TaxID=6248 RepID=A0A0K0E5U0_STRER
MTKYLRLKPYKIQFTKIIKEVDTAERLEIKSCIDNIKGSDVEKKHYDVFAKFEEASNNFKKSAECCDQAVEKCWQVSSRLSNIPSSVFEFNFNENEIGKIVKKMQ